MIAKLFKKRINTILGKFNDKDIIATFKSANFFGLQSKGIKQVRGNGVLLLTRNNLYYEMWVKPKTIIEIPIKSIENIESVKFHIHKTRFTKLLKVYFRNQQGKSDSVAWWVKNLEEWMEVLEKLIHIER